MRKIWHLITGVVFWSYKRGSLPYDVMVIVILAFVLLTPRSWFHDRPKIGTEGPAGQIRLMDTDPSTNTELFRVDANLLELPPQTGELEKETHKVLSRGVTSLHGKIFRIVRIQAVRAADGHVVGYDVRIKPAHPPSP